MKIAFRIFKAIVAIVICSFLSEMRAAEVLWISTTQDHHWRKMDAPAISAASDDAPAQIRVVTGKTFQTIDGFGGCFNELGWEALKKASDDDGGRVMQALFGDDGCAFTMARIPIGASDFALDAYSLDDVKDDYDLKHFSIERDRKSLLPFIKAAMQVRPALKCWGSAWSPPAWMKSNNHYSAGSLKWEPKILQSYATYLSRWVEAYRGEGVNVFAVFTQNEPNIVNVYPTCIWTGPQLREFVGNYLGPTLRDRKVDVELWLGTLNDDNVNDRVRCVLEDPAASKFIAGVSFQYDAKNQIAAVSELHPNLKLMQSETECNDGKNSWDDAQRLYGLVKHYLDRGANSYFMWNMVLDETGVSSWNWKQNTMISIRRDNGEVIYNGEYYVMRHFSQFVKPGAKRALATGPWGDKIAFVNPDGSVVFVVGNSAARAYSVVLNVSDEHGEKSIKLELSAKSINTVVVPADQYK